MPRQSGVFVRELDPDEAQRLVEITCTARDRVGLRGAGVGPDPNGAGADPVGSVPLSAN